MAAVLTVRFHSTQNSHIIKPKCSVFGLMSFIASFFRLFSVSDVKRQIDLLWETFYHQRCVLSVATCSLEDGTGSR